MGKKGKVTKRKRVERAYGERGDEMVDGAEVRAKLRASGTGRRPTQERADSLRRRWKRSEEVRFEARKYSKFAKPEPAAKVKGPSQRQRRNARRKRAFPAGEEATDIPAWPTAKAVKRHREVVGGSWEAAAKELELGSGRARGEAVDAESSEEEEEEEASGSESDEEVMPDIDAGDDEDVDAALEESDEEAPEAALDRCGGSDAIAADARRQFHAQLDPSEKARLEQTRAAPYSADAKPAPPGWSWTPGEDTLVGVSSLFAGDDADSGSEETAGRVLARLSDAVRSGFSASRTPTRTQLELVSALGTFRDVLATNAASANAKPVLSRRDELLEACLAHAVDHALRSRAAVLRHDAKLRKRQQQQQQQQQETGQHHHHHRDNPDEPTADETDWRRDQGLSRPRVLVLCPTRDRAYAATKTLIGLLGDAAGATGTADLEADYGPVELEKGVAARRGPRDWEELFRETRNLDDDFELGVGLSPGRGKRLKDDRTTDRQYARRDAVVFGVGVRIGVPTAKSDVVLASPLALKSRLERDGSLDELSSIEICLVDSADVMLYQNWDFVETVLAAVNRRPKLGLPPALDVSRVRFPELEGQARHCRQTVIVARFPDARLRAALDAPGRSPAAREAFDDDDDATQKAAQMARNRAGGIRISPPPVSEKASALAAAASKCDSSCRFVFRRLPASTPAAASDAKLAYFADHLASKLKPRTLVVTNTYHEFLAARAALRAAAVDFAAVHEYSRRSEVSRARSNFFHGRVPVLLYSGRAHFYERHRLRGASTTVFLSPPDLAVFFPELVARMFDKDHRFRDDASSDHHHHKAVLLLYSRFDALPMERILGATRAKTKALAPAADDVLVFDVLPDDHDSPDDV